MAHWGKVIQYYGFSNRTTIRRCRTPTLVTPPATYRTAMAITLLQPTTPMGRKTGLVQT